MLLVIRYSVKPLFRSGRTKIEGLNGSRHFLKIIPGDYRFERGRPLCDKQNCKEREVIIMAEEERGASAGTILISLLAGMAVGSGLALLFAPKSGREMREQMKDLSDDAAHKIREYARDAQEKIKSAYEEGKELVTEKKTLIGSAIEAGREAIERSVKD
jgi:gas vesicle protein